MIKSDDFLSHKDADLISLGLSTVSSFESLIHFNRFIIINCVKTIALNVCYPFIVL